MFNCCLRHGAGAELFCNAGGPYDVYEGGESCAEALRVEFGGMETRGGCRITCVPSGIPESCHRRAAGMSS
jgi:hypothetical protein